MRRTKTLSALVLLVSLFLIFFYATLHLETAYSLRAGPEDLLRDTSLQVHDSDGKAQSSKQERFTIPLPDVLNVSVSDGLKQAIPQNGAYWNRLLYSALRNLDKGGNPFGNESDWSLCRQKNQEHLQTNVHDFTSYPVLLQDFLKGMNCRSPPVLLNQPNKCISGEGKGDNRPFLLFAIKSTPGNFEQRQAVRETWGREGVYQSGLRVHTLFLLGSSPLDDPDLSSLLSFEARHFGDLLQWDFHESLLNLTLKMNMLLQWTVKYCPTASFVFSGDDDVFVNTPALLRYLQSLEPSKASQLYAGQVISRASPLRVPKNKYYIPLSFYDGPYPAYAGGGGFVLSGALLQRLYSISRVIPFYPIDDVYAGMCFKALGVSPEANAGFQTFDINEQYRENLCVNKNLILIHRRSPQQMKKLWKGIHSLLLTC
ncbi:N-acetyllactosaminide beta-1,3-N-acetylglucosaminyltransferase 2 [Anoplopoma fimbria]|uniref:N-acetyllactosaminide beta-1,3-N-acetylglucosaminyltransferase 2 n=1 Tax=Anoplopoma fimbria TaxID=229290 RepID=UPI0023EB2825|nr:N-acetyllactosaminide beta-1,3-N-acetylglucosaminyltransferase 2 [Anoplopoma fimbria]XP_054459227.1 N-acetyllactosaminide beta-1,3-N-acetylglucosaminyltransferase 2 [Anoplopoma fimbria]XP_054459234.1 N-acetyllactosaminide beta-1,3-N-acetylglucosaminyltransferase 2 [Anoplopoma fimbria]